MPVEIDPLYGEIGSYGFEAASLKAPLNLFDREAKPTFGDGISEDRERDRLAIDENAIAVEDDQFDWISQRCNAPASLPCPPSKAHEALFRTPLRKKGHHQGRHKRPAA